MRPWYSLAINSGRFAFFFSMRVKQLRPQLAERDGAYILALTHLGNLDPLLASVLIRRPIRWMTRTEYFVGIRRWFLPKLGAFSVNRWGIPVSSIRKSIAIVRAGEVLGVCPEGEVRRQKETAFRGGAIKRGICSVAIRSGAPIVPCVMLGTPDLNRVKPWLPTKSGKLWVAYGEAIIPPRCKSTRASREALRAQLSEAYQKLYREMCEAFDIDDADVP